MCVCQEGQASRNLPACLSVYGLNAFGEDYWATQRNAIIAVMYTRWLSVLLRVGLFLRQDSSVLNAANKRGVMKSETNRKVVWEINLEKVIQYEVNTLPTSFRESASDRLLSRDYWNACYSKSENSECVSPT